MNASVQRLLSLFVLAVTLGASAQEASPPVSKPTSPVCQSLPPEAFTMPSNYVALVNLGGAVDRTWHEEQAAAMQRSLMVGVKAKELELRVDGEVSVASKPVDRATVLGLFDVFPKAKIIVVLADGDGLAPILASPYENWVVMDAGWVKRGGGDAAVVNDRMGKRIYQALGACCGAAYHPEREAVMRYSPTPASLDECLSHNFHPLNSNAFAIVSRAVGLDPVRLRPRKELLEMGILKPRGATTTNAPVAKPAEDGE